MSVIERVARADQRPRGSDLGQDARDSLLRYCAHHRLLPTDIQVTFGEVWREVPLGEPEIDADGKPTGRYATPTFWPAGWAPTGISAARAVADVRPIR